MITVLSGLQHMERIAQMLTGASRESFTLQPTGTTVS